eukprot:gene14071-18879_t
MRINNTLAQTIPNDRKVQAKYLRKILEDLEDSDYGSYGSWGNFRIKEKSISDVVAKQKISNETNKLSCNLFNNTNTEIFVGPILRHPELINSNLLHILKIKSDQHRNNYKIHQRINRQLNRKSVVHLSLFTATLTTLSFLTVTPRIMSNSMYNAMFVENLARASLSMLLPTLMMIQSFNNKICNINLIINQLFNSIFIGYPSIVLLEYIFATAIRIVILRLFDPNALLLTPDIPGIILPWTLTNLNYKPKKITNALFVFLNDCIMSPIIEESIRYYLFNRNLMNLQDYQSDLFIESNVTVSTIMKSPKTYLICMATVSIGYKIADNTRRIILYNAPHHRNKMMYALLRSILPIEELCGAIILFAKIKVDFFGFNNGNRNPIKIIGFSVILRILANLKGHNPFYVWKSNRPWIELQLPAWTVNSITGTGINMDIKSLGSFLFRFILSLWWFRHLIQTGIQLIRNYKELIHANQ